MRIIVALDKFQSIKTGHKENEKERFKDEQLEFEQINSCSWSCQHYRIIFVIAFCKRTTLGEGCGRLT